MRDDTLEQLVCNLSVMKNEGCFGYEENISAPKIDTYKNSSSAWAKGILMFENEREASECVARVYFSLAQKSPDSSVVLPTGRSATMVFRAMLKIAEEYDNCPFGDAHLISDTETFGVWSGHETSRTGHIIEMLIDPLKRKGKAPNDEQVQLLSGIYTQDDPVKQAQKTLRLYPPVVHAISVSPLGEILAYEVGTYNDIEDIIDDTPKIVEVGEHSKKYIDPNQPSKSILTIGLGSSLASNYLLILFFDIQKANMLNRMFSGPMTAGIPATILRRHPNAYVITTKKVAQEANIDFNDVTAMEPKEASEWILKR